MDTELDLKNDPATNSADEDPLFFRGFLFAIFMSLPFWIVFGWIAYLVGKA